MLHFRGRNFKWCDRRLEVYRNPAGDSYRSVTNHAAGDNVAPLARPDAQIVVDDLLPASEISAARARARRRRCRADARTRRCVAFALFKRLYVVDAWYSAPGNGPERALAGERPNRTLYVGAVATAAAIAVNSAFRNAATYEGSSSAPEVAR